MFLLQDGQPIQYKFDSPFVGLTFPPDNLASTAADLVEHLLQFLLNAVLNDASSSMLASVKALIDIIKNPVAGNAPSVNDLVSAAAGIAGDATKFNLGDNFSISITPDGNLEPSVTIGPLAPDWACRSMAAASS